MVRQRRVLLSAYWQYRDFPQLCLAVRACLKGEKAAPVYFCLFTAVCVFFGCENHPSADRESAPIPISQPANSPLTKAQKEQAPKASAAWNEAERLHSQQELIAKKAALLWYRKAYNEWFAVGFKQGAIAALRRIGEIHTELSQAEEALCWLQRALQLSGATSESVTENALTDSGIYNAISEAYRLLGRNFESHAAASKALSLSETDPQKRERGSALGNLGDCAYAIGERMEAFDYYARAQAEFERLGDQREAALMLLYQGHIFNDLGAPHKAQQYFQQAQQIWENLQDIHGKALVLIANGHLQAKIGNGEKAQEFYRQATPLIALVGDRIWEGSLLNGAGYLFANMHSYESALDAYERAAAVYQEIQNAPEEASTLITISSLLQEMKRPADAQKKLRQAQALVRNAGDSKTLPSVLRQFGTYYAERKNWRLAERYLRDAYQLHRQHGELRGQIRVLNQTGQLYAKRQLWLPAVRAFNRALQLELETQNRLDQVKTRYQLALLERARGRLAAAILHVEEALALAEELRLQVASKNLRTAYFANAQDYFDLYLDLLMRQDKVREAFEVSERARARGLNELLTEARAKLHEGADPQLLEKEARVREQLRQKAERLQLVLQGEEREREQREKLRLESQRDDLESQIRAQNTQYATLTRPLPASLTEVQRLLPEDTYLLEYALGPERSHLWLITSKTIQHFPLPNQFVIEREVERLTQALRQTQRPKEEEQMRDYWQMASKLSRILLPAALARTSSRRLVIVPSGALNFLSFAALPAPGQPAHWSFGEPPEKRPRWLVAQHRISYLPSASTMLILREQARPRPRQQHQVAVIADGVYAETDLRLRSVHPWVGQNTQLPDLNVLTEHKPQTRDQYQRLDFAKDEANFINSLVEARPSRVWKDFDANIATAQSAELAAYRIVHFAAHGTISRDYPELSAVVLSLYDRTGKPQAGHLLLSDIYQMRLPADLVVLSACDTALGKAWRGEGVEGLVRSFMHAGASRVIASLWKVDDEATAELMKRFYTNHFKACLPIAESLSEAQKSLASNPQWQHPAYWAGFVMQGEWQW